jgi:dimethylargininase
VITAITRSPGATMATCELTFLERMPIDIERARAQHAAYRAALAAAGAHVVLLPALDELPDAVFVEDTAIVLDPFAIVAPMGAASRKRETAPMAATLKRYRTVHALTDPATLEGGDVARVGRTLYVGQTARSNSAAVDQLNALIGPSGYCAVGVPITGCLHLKSAVTSVGEGTVLLNPEWVEADRFADATVLTVDPDEPFGANALPLGDVVIMPASAPRTRERLARAGLRPVAVDISEFEKAEAAVTCLSILITT